MHHFADDTNLLLTENSLNGSEQINVISKYRKKQKLFFSNQEIGRLQNTSIVVKADRK